MENNNEPKYCLDVDLTFTKEKCIYLQILNEQYDSDADIIQNVKVLCDCFLHFKQENYAIQRTNYRRLAETIIRSSKKEFENVEAEIQILTDSIIDDIYCFDPYDWQERCKWRKLKYDFSLGRISLDDYISEREFLKQCFDIRKKAYELGEEAYKLYCDFKYKKISYESVSTKLLNMSYCKKEESKKPRLIDVTLIALMSVLLILNVLILFLK